MPIQLISHIKISGLSNLLDPHPTLAEAPFDAKLFSISQKVVFASYLSLELSVIRVRGVFPLSLDFPSYTSPQEPPQLEIIYLQGYLLYYHRAGNEKICQGSKEQMKITTVNRSMAH